MNDFLARIVSDDVLKELRTGGKYDKNKLKFFISFDDPFIPVEFAVAAYRLGHSMVRPGYRLNDATLLPIFPISTNDKPGFPEGLTGFRKMITDWGIDWGRFIDIDLRDYGIDPDTLKPGEKLSDKQARENFLRLQFAYKLDTSLVDPLGRLPEVVAGNKPLSLALRNLMRGVSFLLPSGQDIARAMGAPVLDDKDILIGKASHDPADTLTPIDKIANGAFKNKCPLWTYILAEAMSHEQNPAPDIPAKGGKPLSTPQLGPVGGRIVAEVFLGLMFADKFSYLSAEPNWTPKSGANYQLKDFVKFALGL